MVADPRIRSLFYVASVAFLAYLAFRIAFAGTRLAFIARAAPPGVRGGVVLQVINPKAYAVNTTFFSGFAFLADAPGFEIALKLIILNVIWIAIHFLWLWLGLSIQRLDLSPARQRSINIAMAFAMLMVVALAALAPH